MESGLAERKTRWEVRVLIVGLCLSVIANVLSIPGAIQQWSLGKLDKKEIELDVRELREKKTQLEKELRAAQQELDARIRVVNEHLGAWDEEAIAAFDLALRAVSGEAVAVREEANKKIRALDERLRGSLVDKLGSGIGVGAVHLLAFDRERLANRVVSQEELSRGGFSDKRYEALVNGRRVRARQTVNGLTITRIDSDGVTFSTSSPDYPEPIVFTLKPSRMWITDFGEYLLKFPELRVK